MPSELERPTEEAGLSLHLELPLTECRGITIGSLALSMFLVFSDQKLFQLLT